MEEIITKTDNYKSPKKEIMIVAHSEYLNRMYWSGEAYEFYVYCHIANRVGYFRQPYITTITKLAEDLKMDRDLTVRIINALINNDLICAHKVNGKEECYAFEILEDTEDAV